MVRSPLLTATCSGLLGGEYHTGSTLMAFRLRAVGSMPDSAARHIKSYPVFPRSVLPEPESKCLRLACTKSSSLRARRYNMDATYHLNGGFKPALKRFADLDGPDFFPTPAWATYALIENEPFEGEIWEPACGDGSMAEVLGLFGNPVIASDLYDRGFGTSGIDFLKSNQVTDNIVTNPPYNSAEGFVQVG